MDDNNGLSYFFLGLGVGVAVGMIFAPQAGTETRSQLRSRAQEGGDYLKKQADDLRTGAEDLVERGKQAVRSGKDRVASSIDAGKQAYHETVTGEPQTGGTDIASPSEGI